MVEGGATVFTSLLREHRIDKIALLVSPVLYGGGESVPLLGDFGLKSQKERIVLKAVSVSVFGGDLLLVGYPKYP